MFSTSLRRHPSSAILVPLLTSRSSAAAFKTPLRGKKIAFFWNFPALPLSPPHASNEAIQTTYTTLESDLQTHDISIPLPILSAYISELAQKPASPNPPARTTALNLLAHATSSPSGVLEEKTVFVLSDMCTDLRDVVRAVQESMKRGDAEKRVREGRGLGNEGCLERRAGLEGEDRVGGGFELEEWVSEKERGGMEGFWAGNGVVDG